MSKLILASALFVPLLVIGSIWAPPLEHHYVRAPAVTVAVIEKLRSTPADETLAELGAAKHALIPPLGRLIEDPVTEADALLERSVVGAVASGPHQPGLFDPDRLGDLDYASLSVPRTLLKAYAATRDERYFDAAHEFLFDWTTYELGAWLPRGLLWNDHAIAARSHTYAEFWRVYRRHHDFNEREARLFLRLVAVSAKRLADPDQYAYASNHGTMQNVALMQLALAFPELDRFRDLADLGIQRQIEQSRYMISSEGVVLEHSAGYHRLGMELLAVALRYRTMQGKALSAELAETYLRTLEVYRQLRANDGTLPPIGDTSIARIGPEPLTTAILADGSAAPLRRDRDWGRPVAAGLYPDAGYALWWSNRDSATSAAQTAMTWAYFPRHGHKHADELSLNVRTGAVRWWTSVGYWPLGHAQRRAAKSWPGSNAPHLVGEPFASARQSVLRGHAAADGLYAIDLTRTGPGEFAVRRQVVHLQPDVWLTVDSYQGSPGQDARIVWGSGRDVRIARRADSGAFELSAEGEKRVMQAYFFGDPDVAPSVVRAQTAPFAGWVEDRFQATPADALIIETPAADTWVANLSILRDESSTSAPIAATWQGPESWRFNVDAAAEAFAIERAGARVRISRGQNSIPRELEISVPADPSTWREEAAANYALAASHYHVAHHDLIPYRQRISIWLTVLLAMQVVFLWLVALKLPRWTGPSVASATLAWLAVAGWLHLSYLAV